MSSSKNIIFDYDGTLHNSIKIYSPAFREAYKYLVKKGYAKHREWKDDEISIWLGYSSKDMWNNFMPELPQGEKEKCSSIIGSYMIECMANSLAELYDGSIEILEYLKQKGYNLIFLSNCKIKYMDEHRRIFKLDKYFNDFYCTEEFDFKPKYEIFNRIKEKYLGDFIVVGDRDVDIELAKTHGLYSIGCTYGFGSLEELKSADVKIDSILEIKDIL
ncbi:HAD family hydrolase [Clostridium cylindrosporum]|uniref:Putative hydrolase, haloacid dehalogenase family n=1 Tax=Clostridium cylindrosporum DSM 605 TaxID=1121307 RepID=A0A0J8D9L9_CLOCY|nr:HAD family hydrolase [Clostridium cylindrosporum]KMT20999.1 putative hydrolase, haloacid dehalogenase family [Clostridium cylindrosporum DSM 605]